MRGWLRLCGFSPTLVATRILPGVAISIFAGNVFYAWQARRLANRTGRRDVTAIPFGVNTPTIFAYIALIMLPVYQRTHDPWLTWQVGVFASFVSGLVQTAGAFCTDWMRRYVPRAALLCPLAGIAHGVSVPGFHLRRVSDAGGGAAAGGDDHDGLRFALAASVADSGRDWWRWPWARSRWLSLKALHLYSQPAGPPLMPLGVHLPHVVNLFEFLRQGEGWKYLSIILPMSVLDTLVSLQILESVKLAGDDYPTRPSLLVNGVATLVAALFGSPFPTTLYFGHMVHKSNGARAGYSILSGAVVMLVCMTGLVPAVLHWVPLAVVAMVIVWFGLVMVGQAFQEVSKEHCVAVALGLVPMLAAWALQLVDLSAHKSGSSLFDIAPKFGDELAIYGMIALSQGSLLVSMLWAAALAWMFDRRFLHAALWLMVGVGAFVLWRDSRLCAYGAGSGEQAWVLGGAGVYDQLCGGSVVSGGLSFLCGADEGGVRGGGLAAS